LRGVAAIEVVIFHLNRAFNIIVLSPAVSEHGPANIGQCRNSLLYIADSNLTNRRKGQFFVSFLVAAKPP